MAKFDKKKLYEELSTRYNNPDENYQKKLKKYNRIVNRAKVLSNLIYDKKTSSSTKNDLLKMLIDEYYSYQGSILKSFRNLKSRSVEENFERAKQLRTKDRFSNFLELFGEQEYTYNNKTKTLNEWMKEYLKGNISSKDLYFIYQWWQALNSDYMNEFYKQLETNRIYAEQMSSGNMY